MDGTNCAEKHLFDPFFEVGTSVCAQLANLHLLSIHLPPVYIYMQHEKYSEWAKMLISFVENSTACNPTLRHIAISPVVF